MAETTDDRERFLALVRTWHTGHPRPDQVEHCQNVAGWLERALDREPLEVQERGAMLLAALGHDLYEDSDVPPAEVAAFGAEVDRLIRALTEGDSVAAYVERVATGPEEARLIKLCDGIDNYGGLVRNGLVQSDPLRWVAVVRSHMEPMFSRLAGISFVRYKVAGPYLSEQLEAERGRFWAEIDRLNARE